MIPIQQTKRGGPDVPPDERGDCLGACLASILGVPLDSVRVGHSDDPDWHWWDAAHAALEPHGYELLQAHPPVYAWGYWIASVPSKNLGNYPDGSPVLHVLVMRGWEVAHDPCLGDKYEAGTHVNDLDVRDALVLVPRDIRSRA